MNTPPPTASSAKPPITSSASIRLATLSEVEHQTVMTIQERMIAEAARMPRCRGFDCVIAPTLMMASRMARIHSACGAAFPMVRKKRTPIEPRTNAIIVRCETTSRPKRRAMIGTVRNSNANAA